MTVISLKDFNEKFKQNYPEMIDFYSIEDEQSDELFDGSDTYVDLDDYEYLQTLY